MIESIKIISYLTSRIIRLDDLLFFLIKDFNQVCPEKIVVRGTEYFMKKELVGNIGELIFLTNESLLEEYQTYLTSKKHPQYSEKIKLFRIDSQPAFDRLRKWEHSRKFRNMLIAHNYRNELGVSILTGSSENKFNIPTYNTDFVLISELQKYIFDCLKKHFSEEVNSLDVNKAINDYITYDSEYTPLSEEVNKIKEWRKTRLFELPD